MWDPGVVAGVEVPIVDAANSLRRLSWKLTSLAL